MWASFIVIFKCVCYEWITYKAELMWALVSTKSLDLDLHSFLLWKKHLFPKDPRKYVVSIFYCDPVGSRPTHVCA